MDSRSHPVGDGSVDKDSTRRGGAFMDGRCRPDSGSSGRGNPDHRCHTGGGLALTNGAGASLPLERLSLFARLSCYSGECVRGKPIEARATNNQYHAFWRRAFAARMWES